MNKFICFKSYKTATYSIKEDNFIFFSILFFYVGQDYLNKIYRTKGIFNAAENEERWMNSPGTSKLFS